jgi:WD40 repeat protein
MFIRKLARLRRVAALVCVFALVLVGRTIGQQGRDEKPQGAGKTDAFGDPLPEGALARMGTLRWRHPTMANVLGYSKNGKHLVTSCMDGFYRVWDVANGKEIRRFGSKPENGPGAGQIGMIQGGGFGGGFFVNAAGMGGSATLAPGGDTLAASGPDGQVRLWDVTKGKEIRTLGAKLERKGFWMAGPSNLAFALDGKTLATRSLDGIIRLWDTANGKEIRSIGKRAEQGGVGLGMVTNMGGALSFMPGGKALVCSRVELENQAPSSSLVFYDVESGKEIRTLKVQQNFFSTTGFAISPDAKSLVWAANDGTVRIVEIESGKEVRTLGQPRQGRFVQSLTFSPDGKVLATQAFGSPAITLWSMDKGEKLGVLGPTSGPAAGNGAFAFVALGGPVGPGTVAFAPDGKTLAEATGNVVRIWHVASRKEILPQAQPPRPRPAGAHSQGVSRLGVSLDGKVLTTYGADQAIRQWNIGTGQETRSDYLPGQVANVALSADGKWAAYLLGNTARLWDVGAGKEVRTMALAAPQQGNIGFGGFAGFGGGLGGPALSPNGKLLAVRAFDQTIRLLDTTTGNELRQFGEQPKGGANPGNMVVVWGGMLGVSPMVIGPDNNTLAVITGSGMPQGGVGFGGGQMAQDQAIRLWSLAGGKRPRTFDSKPRAIQALAFAPDGQTIVSANADNSLSVWEVLTGKECLHIQLEAAKGPAQPGPFPVNPFNPMLGMATGIHCLAVSPDGRTLAGGGPDRSVRLWDLRNRKELGAFKGHDGAILTVAFAPDSRTLFSGSADTTALVWDGKRLIKDDPPAGDLTEAQAKDLWKDLAGDAGKAYAAIVTLGRAPKQAMSLLQDRLKSVQGVDEARVKKLITDLESKGFKARQEATDELEKLGELAQPALQKALEKPSSLEMRRRLEKLLDQIQNDRPPPAELLQALRGVNVLERLATSDARQILERLSQGAAGARLTRHAKSAVTRLQK